MENAARSNREPRLLEKALDMSLSLYIQWLKVKLSLGERSQALVWLSQAGHWLHESLCSILYSRHAGHRIWVNPRPSEHVKLVTTGMVVSASLMKGRSVMSMIDRAAAF